MLASRYAKAPLGVAHRFAPSRVYKMGVMQSGLRWERSHSRRRFPVVGTPYAPPSARPCGSRGGLASVRRCASIPASGLRPVIPVSPRPPHRGLAATRHWPPCAGQPVCPPRGRPQSGAKTRRLAAATINCWSRQPETEYVVRHRATVQPGIKPLRFTSLSAARKSSTRPSCRVLF